MRSCGCNVGQTHRKTLDGRLCAAAYVHDSQAFTVQVFSDATVVVLLDELFCRTATLQAAQKGSQVVNGAMSKCVSRAMFLLCYPIPFATAGTDRKNCFTEVGAGT